MTPRLQQGHWLSPTSRASKWALVATCATNFNIEPSCSWTIDPDMAIGSSLVG